MTNDKIAASPPSGTVDAANNPETGDPVREALTNALYEIEEAVTSMEAARSAIRSALAQPAPPKDGEQSPLEVVKQEIRDWFEGAEDEIPDDTPMNIGRTTVERPSGLTAGHLRALIAEQGETT